MDLKSLKGQVDDVTTDIFFVSQDLFADCSFHSFKVTVPEMFPSKMQASFGLSGRECG